jgi:hypothetical protein
MSNKHHLNFLTHDNGVKVVECSSASKGSSPEHLLQNTRKVSCSYLELVAQRCWISAIHYFRPYRNEEASQAIQMHGHRLLARLPVEPQEDRDPSVSNPVKLYQLVHHPTRDGCL